VTFFFDPFLGRVWRVDDGENLAFVRHDPFLSKALSTSYCH